MNRVKVLALSALIALAGCNSAKSAVIPSDPQKWDQISDAAKSLGEEDRKLLTAYMLRMSMAAAFNGGKGGIPPGTTIGDAIKAQQDWQAQQSADEAKANALKAKVEAERNAAAAEIRKSATIAVTNMKIQTQDVMAGRYSDRLSLTIAIENKTSKKISGIKGVVEFYDQFGVLLSSLSLSLDEDVEPTATRTIDGYGRDLNQFMDEDQKLATVPFGKMKVVFLPEMIVFADGSKIGSASQPTN